MKCSSQDHYSVDVNSYRHQQSAIKAPISRQSCMLVIKTSTNTKNSSNTEVNNTRCNNKTHLPRPSANITTKDIAVNMNPMTTNEAPARSTNQTTAHCQTTKPPLLPTPPVSMRTNYNRQFLAGPFTYADNHKQFIIGPPRQQQTPYFTDHLHHCFQWAILQHHTINSLPLQEHTCTYHTRNCTFPHCKYQYICQF